MWPMIKEKKMLKLKSFKKLLRNMIIPVSCLMILSGCMTVPVKTEFPIAPAELLQTPPMLQQVRTDNSTSDVKLSDFVQIVVNNYNTYYDQREILLAWQQWYSENKKIFDDANK